MGCFPSRSKQDITGNPKQVRRTARKLYQKGTVLAEKNLIEKAIVNFLNACDIDIRVNWKQTEFSFGCVYQISELYIKLQDSRRAILYLKHQIDYYACRNAIEQGTFVKEYASALKSLSSLYLKKKENIKAYFFLQQSLALEEKEENRVAASILTNFTQEENKVLQEINKDLKIAFAYLSKDRHDSRETAERYIEAGKKLVDLGRPRDSLIYFRRALDYYTIKNHENPKYGEWIGLVYYEIGQAFKDRGNQKSAAIYLSLAKELVRSVEKNREMVHLYHQRSLKKLSETDKATSETFDREKSKIHSEIQIHETETSDVYFSYLVIAKDLINRNKHSEAKIYLTRAHDFASFKSYHDATFAEFFGDVTLHLAKVYLSQKKLVQAQFYLERSIHLLKEPLRTDAANQLSTLNLEIVRQGIAGHISNLTQKTIEKRSQAADHSQFKKDHIQNKL